MRTEPHAVRGETRPKKSAGRAQLSHLHLARSASIRQSHNILGGVCADRRRDPAPFRSHRRELVVTLPSGNRNRRSTVRLRRLSVVDDMLPRRR
jgi:hypothetical protein